jgi:hypothetical protein
VDLGDDEVRIQVQARAHRMPGGVGSHDGHRAVGLEAEHSGDLRTGERLDLVAYRSEERVRRHALRDQRGHAPQGGLLLRQAGHLGLRLTVGGRRREQLREVGQSRLGIGGQRLGVRRGDDHRSPRAPTHGEWGAHRRADADAPALLGDLALHAGVVVDARRSAARSHLAQDARADERPPPPDREQRALRGKARPLGRGAVILESHDAHERDVQHARDLLGHEVEQTRGLGAVRRRHPPQRRLLLRKPARSTSIARVRLRHGCLGP